MKLSEVPMMRPVLCKNAKAEWSEVFEIIKLGISANGRAVYVRVTFGMPGQHATCHHYWRDVAELDQKWEVFDMMTPNAPLTIAATGGKNEQR